MDKSQKYYSKALDYYQNGYIEKALEYSEKSISLNLKNKGAIGLKGILLYLKGDLEGAKALWKLNKRENNDSVAEKYLQSAINDEEKFRLYVKAVQLIAEVNIIEAIGLLEKCAESDYNTINVNNCLCICYMKTGDYNKAIKCMEKVFKVDRENETAKENRKGLVKFGVIKRERNLKKLLVIPLIIVLCIVVVYVSKKVHLVISNPFKQATNKVAQVQKKPVKVTAAEKQKKKPVEISSSEKFPETDYNNALNSKDFDKLYNYDMQWKDKNLDNNDKVLLSNGETLLKSQGVSYFYKNGSGFYDNKAYKNATDEYLKAYEYADGSYLMPHITYFLATSFQSLNDYDNALKYYMLYDSNFSKGDYEETVLYEMAMIEKNLDMDKAKQYASKLSSSYPKSMYNNSNIKSIIAGNN